MRIRAICTVLLLGTFLPLTAGAAEGEGKTRGAAPPAQTAPACVRGRDLMTPAEFEAHRAKLRSLTGEEERLAYWKEHEAMLSERAAAQGKVLCHETPGGRGGQPRGGQ
jgi:hypothetical protein